MTSEENGDGGRRVTPRLEGPINREDADLE